MSHRDRGWLQTGRVPALGKEPGAKPMTKEIAAAESLRRHGFSVTFIKERNGYRKKTADAYLGSEVWEFKIPEVYGPKTVKNQFKKALGKGTRRLLISSAECSAGLDDMGSDVISLFESGEFSEIDEILLIDAGGIARINRKTAPRHPSA